MRYLVTGGAGFIGSNTVQELVRCGHKVVVLDNLSTGKEANLVEVRDQIEFILGSITDPEKVRAACLGVDYVLHLAARTSVPRSMKEPVETNFVNVDGTLNVLLAARNAKVKRVVFSGSSSAYGETPTLPKHESMTPAPISPYGVTKLMGEIYGKLFHRIYGLEFVALRYFNIFGPRQDPDSPYSGVLSRFNAALLEGKKLTIYGDGEQSRDFTFVANAVQANLLACTAQNVAGLVFNIGTGNRYTLNQTLQMLSKISGRLGNAKYEPAREGDILHSQADVSEAREKLGYDPRVDFEEGLRRTWEWFCETCTTKELAMGAASGSAQVIGVAPLSAGLPRNRQIAINE
jgi:UDP-N-acetylglucosamine/UDP-N-acetyl-alpha-D-glucosaminouronate 4-epimerase